MGAAGGDAARSAPRGLVARAYVARVLGVIRRAGRAWATWWPTPTVRGTLVGLVALLLVGVAIGLHSQPLMFLALAFVAITVLSGVALGWRVWMETGGRTRLTMRVTRAVEPSAIPWGQQAGVHLGIDGGSWTSAPAAREQVSRALLPLVPGQGVYQVTGARRGVWSIGPLSAQRGDALGLWRARYSLGDATSVIVWPQVVRLEQHPFGGWSPEPGPPARHGPVRARLDDMTLREYRPGDELRRIHWRASARRGQLVVRAAEPAHPYGLTIALLLPYSREEVSEAGEWLISAAASAAVTAMKSHARVRIVCGTDLPVDSEHHMLSALARLELPPTPDAARRLATASAATLHQGASGSCLVLTGVPLPEQFSLPLTRFDPVWAMSCGVTNTRLHSGGAPLPVTACSPTDDIAGALAGVWGRTARRAR